MKKPAFWILCFVIISMLACNLTSGITDGINPPESEQPESTKDESELRTDVPISATDTQIPASATPLQPTDTPAPTAVPTSEPLVINDEPFDAWKDESCTTDVEISDYDNGVFLLGGGGISIGGGDMLVFCYGAKHTWIDVVNYEGYVFASEEDDPLQFEVVKDVGYRSIGGTGTVTYPDGTQHELYMPIGTAVEPTAAPVVSDDECQNDTGQPQDYLPLSSSFVTHNIRIDRQISKPDEWSPAVCVDLRMHETIETSNPNIRKARWWWQNDAQYLYVLVRIPREYPLMGVALDYFWPRYTGTWAYSDGIYVRPARDANDHANWDEAQWYEDVELDPPGTIDIEAVVTNDSEYYWLEFKRPLNSGDRYDWAWEPGQTIGYNPADHLLSGLVLDGTFFGRYLQLTLGEP